MRSTPRRLLVTALAAAGLALALPAGAASATIATTALAGSLEGYDVSHPQCGTALPEGQAFGVVGVNGGLSTRANSCLSAQLAWAARSSGALSTQPRAQLYLNTANPGQLIDQITTWPTSGSTPYGTCTGTNSDACSWQYGWERAQHSVTTFFAPAAEAAAADADPADYLWWLDVETYNTWQTGSTSAQEHNRVSLEGMTAYLNSRGAMVGLYAVPAQWAQVVGAVTWDSTLYRLPSWLPGATSAPGAHANCTRPPLVPGGAVTLAQYVSGGLDHDVSCP